MTAARSLPPPRPVTRSLAARLFALALVQLAVIALAGLVLAQLFRPPPPRDLGALVRSAAAVIEPAIVGGDLAGALARASEGTGLELSVYDAGGAVTATTVEPPVRLDGPPDGRIDEGPPSGRPPPRGLFDLGPPPPRPMVVAIGEHRLAARPARPAPVYLGTLLTLLTGILVLGLGGIVTARWIVRPLDDLRRTARAIAGGELSARTGLRRDDEIGELARGFDEMAGRIEVLMKKERELLANVSHELRTPLARIRVALDMATEGQDAGKAALEGAFVDLEELESIVEGILAAARMAREPGAMDAGLPARSLREVDAAEIAEGAAQRFRTAYPSRPLEVRLEPPLPAVLVEPALLRRVLGNLLENAHKYSPEPSSPIVLSARALPTELELEVEDRGSGIEPEDLPRVFEPFFRAEKSRTRRAGGVGLGLTLSKRIVEAHGGTLVLESTPGEGTTARVRLPIRPV